MNRILLIIICSLALLFNTQAQPSEQIVKIIVAPDHSDWRYAVGEKVKFTISVLQYGNPAKNVPVYYEVGPERMTPFKKDSLTLANGSLVVDGGSMKVPGFLRCVVTARLNGKDYKKLATAGIDPEKIKPVIEMPADFNSFWDKAKSDLSRIPLDTRMTLMPERCTEKVNVYQVSVQNYPAPARLYGILCIPKKEGKYPALLSVPGAGVRPYGGNIAIAERGFITLDIGIHGVPVNMDPIVYTNLAAGALSGYQNANMDDRDRFYYKRVYLGCVRANDLIASLPQFDGKNLGVTGGSQGGALSVVTAALDARVKYFAAYYPALCDLTGDLHGRAGGWPHYFEKGNFDFNNKKDKIATSGYYDVVNFAKNVKIPSLFSWGYNDETCPPTSMYAAYNSISAPKDLFLALETGHWTYPEQNEKLNNWLVEKLTN